MFSNTNFLPIVKEKSDKVIKMERNKFRTIFTHIEKFAEKHKIIISDIDILCDTCIVNYKTEYELYCLDPYRLARELIDELAVLLESKQKHSSKWLMMETILFHQELKIRYDNRNIATVYALNQYKTLNIAQTILPIKKHGVYIENELLYIPPEIELIDIYRKLYLIKYAEQWEELLKKEDILVKTFESRVKSGIITGGDAQQQQIINSITSIKRLFIHQVLPASNYVLVGQWAISMIEWGLTGKISQVDDIEKIQIISENPIEKDVELVQTFLSKLTKYTIVSREQDLRIPKDMMIQKYTLYIRAPCESETKDCGLIEKPIIDIYTCGNYELIPYVNSSRFLKNKNPEFTRNIKIGNPFVILRFLMCDVWILRVIRDLGLLTTDIIKRKIEKIMVIISKIRNPQKLGGLWHKAFGTENYIGTFEDELLFKKKLIKEQKDKKIFVKYYPFKS